MSIRSDRTDDRATRKARKNADKDLQDAKKTARKAIDLKDPRFLAEAAVAATRGPAGLALFGASRGLSVARERRAEQAEVLKSLAHDAKVDAKAAAKEDRKQAARERKAVEKELAKRNRSFRPLLLTGLVGGALVAGATAYFLRDQKTSSSSTAPRTPAPATPASPAPATTQGMAAAAAAHAQAGGVDPDASGEDLVVETPDPEGPGDQQAATTTAASSADNAPTAGSADPGAAAGIAPQPQPTEDDARTLDDK